MWFCTPVIGIAKYIQLENLSMYINVECLSIIVTYMFS